MTQPFSIADHLEFKTNLSGLEELERVLAGIDAGLQRIRERDLEEAKRELSFAGNLLEQMLPQRQPKREEK